MRYHHDEDVLIFLFEFFRRGAEKRSARTLAAFKRVYMPDAENIVDAFRFCLFFFRERGIGKKTETVTIASINPIAQILTIRFFIRIYI